MSEPALTPLAQQGPGQRRWRAVKDQAARWLVGAGGLMVVVALLSIFVYLFVQVLPLFQGATAAARAERVRRKDGLLEVVVPGGENLVARRVIVAIGRSGNFRMLGVPGEELDKVTGDKACPLQEAFHLAGLVALRKQERDRAGELFQKCVSLAPKACLARECTLAASS